MLKSFRRLFKELQVAKTLKRPTRGERCGRLENYRCLLFLFSRVAMSLIPRGVKGAAALRASSSLPQLFFFARVAKTLKRPTRGERCGRLENYRCQLLLFTRVAKTLKRPTQGER